MPILFKVEDSAGAHVSQFAYNDSRDRLGEPSAFGIVFRGYEVDGEGQPLSPPGSWVIKESNSRDHFERFRAEYGVMRALAQETNALVGKVMTPDPVYLLRRIDHDLPGIAMPFYPQKLRDLLVQWDERKLVSSMIDYADVIRALNRVGYICTDRKADDLRWHDDRLMVIDWNVLRPYDASAVQAEIALTVRVWYLLLTGYEPTVRLNPFNDDEWQTFGGHQAGGRISIGLRLVLTYALAGRYPSIDSFRDALANWHNEWLCAPVSQLDQASVTNAFQSQFGVGGRKAQAALSDLKWRMNAGSETERSARLNDLQNNPDELEDIRDKLEEAANKVLSSAQYGNAYELINSLYANNDLQAAAIYRWKLLLQSIRSELVERTQREELRNRHLNRLVEGLRRLARPVQDDERDEALLPLTQVADDFARARVLLGAAGEGVSLIANESRLRALLLDVARSQKENPNAPVYANLSEALNLLKSLPYAVHVLDAAPLEQELEELQTAEAIREGVERDIQTVQEIAVATLQNWRAPAPAPNFTDMLRQIEKIEQGLTQHQIEREQFIRATLPYRHLARYLPEAGERSPNEEAIEVQEILARLPRGVRDAFAPALKSVVAYVTERYVTRIEADLDKGTSNALADAHEHLKALTDPKLASLLTDEMNARLKHARTRLESYQQLVELIRKQHPPAEIVQFARENNISLLTPLVQNQLSQALKEANESRALLGDEFNRLHQEVLSKMQGSIEQIEARAQQEQRALEAMRADVQRQVDERAQALEARIATQGAELQHRVDERIAAVERTARSLRVPLIAVFVLLGGLLLALIAGIVFTNNSVSEQTNALRNQLIELTQGQGALASSLEDNFILQTESAIQVTLEAQRAQADARLTATAAHVSVMSTVQAMIDQAIPSQVPPQAFGDALAEATVEALVSETMPEQSIDTVGESTALIDSTQVTLEATSTPEVIPPTDAPAVLPTDMPTLSPTNTVLPILIDRSGETLDSALLTPDERAQLDALVGADATGFYLVRFGVDEDGNIQNFITPSDDSELNRLYARLRRSILGAKNAQYPMTALIVELAVRETESGAIVYAATQLENRYAGNPPNSLIVFLPNRLGESYYPYPETPDAPATELRLVQVDAALIAAAPAEVTLKEGEVIAAFVSDGKLERIFAGVNSEVFALLTPVEAHLLDVIDVSVPETEATEQS
jgi:hypothetical protein